MKDTTSESSQEHRQYREDQKQRRQERLPVRTEEILALVNEGYKVVKLTDYQFRINDLFDLYPIHNRWHNIKTNKRGGAKNLSQFIRQQIKLTI